MVFKERFDRRFFVNSWLIKEEMLVPIRNLRFIDVLEEKLADFAVSYAKIDRVTLSRIYTRLKNFARRNKKSFTEIFLDKIDFKRSKAFAYNTSAGGYTCIRIQDEEVISEIKDKLRKVNDPTGLKPVKKLHERKLGDAYELIIEGHERYIFNHEITHKIFKIGLRSFKHSMNGIFIVSGGEITKTERRASLNIFDVAPTLLYIMDENPNLLGEIDGKIIEVLNTKEPLMEKVPSTESSKSYTENSIHIEGRG